MFTLQVTSLSLSGQNVTDEEPSTTAVDQLTDIMIGERHGAPRSLDAQIFICGQHGLFSILYCIFKQTG